MANRVINDTQLTAIADAIRDQLSSDVTMKPGQMPALICDIGVGYVPDYWRSYLQTKVTEINAALDAAGEKRSAFLWYTDAHWTTNYGQSPMILRYLSMHTGMTKTYFGGDVAVEASGETDILTEWLADVSTIPNHRSMIGNHDNNYNIDFPTTAERAEFFLQTNRTSDMAFGTDITNGRMYYYVDDHIEKTRYIILSTGRMWTNADEVKWCVDVLNSTPNGWHIVVAAHLWLNNNYEVSPVVPLETPERYTQVFLDLFDAYNYRESGTTDFASTAYDFTNGGAKVEFVIGGHIHQDYDITTATGIPVIMTECDAWQEREVDYDPTKGTTTESCVYAIIADYVAKVVKVINVGRGSTRSLALPDVVTYTNLLPTAIGFNCAVLNADTTPGYAANSRYSTSSDKLSALTGTYATGLIPCSVGSIVYLKDISSETANSYDGFWMFDMNDSNADGKMYLTKYTFTEMIDTYPDAFLPVVDENGTLVQFTIPTWQKNITHFAVCSQYIGAGSIVTVDEPIE